MPLCFLTQDKQTRFGSPNNYFYEYAPHTTLIFIDDSEPEEAVPVFDGVYMGELDDFTDF